MKLEERGRRVSERTHFSNGHESLLAQNKDITNLKKHVSVNLVSEGRICISSLFFFIPSFTKIDVMRKSLRRKSSTKENEEKH